LKLGRFKGKRFIKNLYREILGRYKMDLFWTVAVVLIVLWLLGFLGGIGGSLIHALLVIALIVIVIRLVQGRGV
jgi:hypothetical protein